MKKTLWTFAIVASCMASTAQEGFSQTPRQQRLEARAQRQELRQEARADIQAQRLANTTQYYSPQTWTQLSPWITRNQVPPLARAAQATGTAVTAAQEAATTANTIAANNAAARAAYGYNAPNPVASNWFYDYYTYSPTYYSTPAAGTTVYGPAARYYDLNGDGIFDTLGAYRSSANNGVYDVYHRYDFADVDKAKPQPLPSGLTDANRHTVTGQIEDTKVAKVNGVDNLVAQVADAKNPGQKTIVDLGAADRWQGKPVQQGDTLSATGPVEQVGDKQVLIAETVSVGNQQNVQIARTAPMLEGQVVDVTRAQVEGAEHTLAIVDNGSTRQIVDLGPTSDLKVKIAPQVKVAVQGVPVQVRDRSVLMAERVVVDGQEIPIQRWFR